MQLSTVTRTTNTRYWLVLSGIAIGMSVIVSLLLYPYPWDWSGLFILICGLFLTLLFTPIVRIVDRIDLFSPYVIFPLVWITASFISSWRLTIFEAPRSFSAWLYLALALLSYLMGALVVFFLKPWLGSIHKVALQNMKGVWDDRRLRIIIIVILFISSASLVYEYRHAGGIPLLSPDIELVRFRAIVSGYIDTLAISFRIVVMVLGVHILSKRGVSLLKQWKSVLVVLLCLLILMTTARRGTVIQPLFVLFISYHFLRRSFSTRQFFFLGVAGLLFVSLFAHYRYVKTFGIEPLENAWRPERFVWLMMGYLNIGDSFNTFQRLTETIPSKVPFQMGRFTAGGVLSALPGHQESIGEFERKIWHQTERYSGSVSTYLAPFYVDFGVVGIILGSFVIGALATFVYCKMRSRPTPFAVLMYAYVAFCLMFVVFENAFTWVLTYYDVLVLFIINRLVRKSVYPQPVAEAVAL